MLNYFQKCMRRSLNCCYCKVNRYITEYLFSYSLQSVLHRKILLTVHSFYKNNTIFHNSKYGFFSFQMDLQQ